MSLDPSGWIEISVGEPPIFVIPHYEKHWKNTYSWYTKTPSLEVQTCSVHALEIGQVSIEPDCLAGTAAFPRAPGT